MIPVHVLTGFLGSGKTMLLRQVLSEPGFSDTAVIVNEFGEIGLDHLLLEEVEEGVLLLQNGCVCCTVRSDLKAALRGLQDRADAGRIEPFARVILETTGLADPAPVVSTLLADPVLRHRFSIGNIVCTVDAVNGSGLLDRQAESVKQISVADRIVVTKCDLVESTDVDVLCARLGRINPAAEFGRRTGAEQGVCRWFEGGVADPTRREEEIARWLAQDGDSAGSAHEGDIRSFCLVRPGALDWTAFGIWLTALLHAHGERVLRVKGILNVRGSLTPVAIHGVQHLMHPPMHLAGWPEGDRDSRIVFITRGLEEADLRASLAAFVGALTPVPIGMHAGEVEIRAG